MKRITLSILVAVFSFFVEARIGKTLEECDEIYKDVRLKSESTQNGFLIRNYATPSVAVVCLFHKNYCFEIAVSLLDKEGKIVSITPEQVGSFINLNLGMIPKIGSEGKNIGANTIEYALGSDGRYVWREVKIDTGLITILRDNILAPPAQSNTQQSVTSDKLVVGNDFKWITINDMLELSKLKMQGKSSFEFTSIP